MDKNFNLSLEELIAYNIKKSVAAVFRQETIAVKNEKPLKNVGGIELAVEITGLAKQTIYTKCSKGTIPYKKRR